MKPRIKLFGRASQAWSRPVYRFYVVLGDGRAFDLMTDSYKTLADYIQWNIEHVENKRYGGMAGGVALG